MYKKLTMGLFFFFVILLAGCQSGNSFGAPLFDESESLLESELEVRESKQDIIDQLHTEGDADIAALISNNFPFVDTVTGEEAVANVYGTLQFEVEELAALLDEVKPATEVSDFKDGQQILIYQDQFVILKESEELPEAILIEVASEQFVKNNYSPNFLTTYFTIRMLDSLFGYNWVNNRQNYCRNNDCYGGYSTTNSYQNDNSSKKRGINSFRGGGPGTGK
ncbi:DUF4247 domain-containing protein [Gracilibacillus alcaliphilus]|uniref:DUF4247 domain-containing protein n=1 Tax=Gracilibacillus alcaliphilus TaxID=1401441 RepID=UPI001EF8FEC6|nr:DUF4247 domain-containing protein [Gracilibacillus alcaliphilus]MBM7676891.1 hypothetical protein [Gracilibacillus alcaliphilus]